MAQDNEATLNRILTQRFPNVSVDELRSLCDDRVFADIASDQIPLEISLSIRLGLNEAQTEQIKRDNPTEREKVIAMFRKWSQMKGSDATYLSLIIAFIKDGNRNTAEFVIERFVHYRLQCKSKDVLKVDSLVRRGICVPHQQRCYYTQKSLPVESSPSFFNDSIKRSESTPVPQKEYCTRKPNNIAWQIFDKYHERIADVLCKNKALCESVFHILYENFLIASCEKEIFEKMDCTSIKAKAIIGRVNTFISKGRNVKKSLAVFIMLMENFDDLKLIIEEMKKDVNFPLRKRKPKPKENPIALTSTCHGTSELNVTKYAQHLRGIYRKMVPDPKWSPSSRMIYIDLALDVKARRYHSGSPVVTTGGVVHCEQPISLHELLHELCQILYGSLLLIEGSPGIGKSMLAYELCSQWINKQGLERYKLLLLFRLREKQLQEISKVEDLIAFFLKGQTWKDDIVKEIIDNSGEGLLIILDGFDELPEDKHSFFINITTILPSASFVFTTRPSAIPKLKERLQFEYHIEIKGFTEESIEQFITRYFAAREDDKFKMHLKQYPNITSCLYIPLNLAIVCFIFEDHYDMHEALQGVLTSTEMYRKLIQMLMYRHLKEKFPDQNISVNELPPSFPGLCQVAYKGLVIDRSITFSLPEGFDTLGLMQKENKVFPESGDTVVYSFLHLVIQEFLAACHMNHSMTRWKIQSQFERKGRVFSLAVMFRFVAGLTKLNSISLDALLPPQDQQLMKKLFNFNVFQFLFESQNEELMRSTFSRRDDVYKVSRVLPVPTPFDMYILGHCVALSSCQWILSFTLRGFLHDHIESFQRGLVSVPPQDYTILEISFSLNPIGNQGIHYILEFPEHVLQNLQVLRLTSVEADVKCLEEFTKCMPRFSNLKKFHFHNNRFREGEQLPLIQTLCSQQIPLKDLVLSNLSKQECVLLLSATNNIQKISLYQLSQNCIDAIVDCLPNASQLQCLHIEQTKCTYNDLTQLPSKLYLCTNIKTLRFINCDIDSSMVPLITEAVLKSESLQNLDLNDNIIDDEGGAKLVEMVHQLLSDTGGNTPRFKELDIGHNPFTEDTIDKMLQVLSCLRTSIAFKVSFSRQWADCVNQYTCSNHRVQEMVNFDKIYK